MREMGDSVEIEACRETDINISLVRTISAFCSLGPPGPFDQC